MSNKNKMQVIALRVPPQLQRMLQDMADAKFQNISASVRDCVEFAFMPDIFDAMIADFVQKRDVDGIVKTAQGIEQFEKNLEKFLHQIQQRTAVIATYFNQLQKAKAKTSTVLKMLVDEIKQPAEAAGQ